MTRFVMQTRVDGWSLAGPRGCELGSILKLQLVQVKTAIRDPARPARLGSPRIETGASVESRLGRSAAAIVSTATPDRAASPTGCPLWEWRPVGVCSRRNHDDLAVAGNRLLLALDEPEDVDRRVELAAGPLDGRRERDALLRQDLPFLSWQLRTSRSGR